MDLNRSLGHRTLFSEFTEDLSRADRDDILRRHYFPFRHRVQSLVESSLERGQAVLHVSVHSFTPVFNGQTRNADVRCSTIHLAAPNGRWRIAGERRSRVPAPTSTCAVITLTWAPPMA